MGSKILVIKKLGPKSIGPKKLGPNKILIYKNFKTSKILCLKILVNIGLVIAEIFFIWTNVARTNISWTNVIVTVGICS